MTPADQYLQADERGRDALLAEHVFGWVQLDPVFWREPAKQEVRHKRDIPRYTTDDLLAECKRRGWEYKLGNPFGRDEATIIIIGKGVIVEDHIADDPKTALAVALLKAAAAEKAGG